MSIHSRPVQGHAQEARPTLAAAPGDGQTLTLELHMVRGGMSGRLVIRESSPAPDGVTLRVKIPKQEPLTFTA